MTEPRIISNFANKEVQYADLVSENLEIEDESEEDVGLLAHDGLVRRARSNSSTEVWNRRSVALVVVASLVSGILIGVSLTLAYSSSHHSDLAGESTNSNSAISYFFLETPKGKKLLSDMNSRLEESGPVDAVRLYMTYQEDAQVAASCHPLLHQLGRHALLVNGFEDSVAKILSEMPLALRICNAALLHGIVEYYLKDATDLSSSIDIVEAALCNNLDNVRDGQWECHHGIGHGILQNVREVKRRETITDAIEICRKRDYADDAENGLWMDYFARAIDEWTHSADPSTMTTLCRDYASNGHAKASCLLYTPTEFLLKYPGKYEDAIEYCNTGLDIQVAATCIEGVGMQMAKENIDDFAVVDRVCRTAATKEHQHYCLSGAIHYYKFAVSEVVPRTLCETLDYFKDYCLREYY